MNTLIKILIGSLLALNTSLAFSAPIGKVTGGINYEIPNWFKESFLDITEDVGEAADENKHVMLFMHLNGCPYCNRMIEENFSASQLKPYLIKHFDSIAINIQGDREIAFNKDVQVTEKQLAQILKVQYTPTIIFLNKNNRPVLRLNGYRKPEVMKQALHFVNEKAYEHMTFNQYKNQHLKSNYTLLASKLFKNITDFSSLETPTAIIFEDKNCLACTEFHNTRLKNPTIIKLLKRYTVVRLDALSEQAIIDFDGNKTTPKQWAETLKLSYRPGIVLFDQGEETARIESFLYPFHFESVLRYGLDKNYQIYNNYLELMSVRQQKLLEQGIDVNIGDTRKQ